jgi:FkbM family methyltransferase
MRGSERIARFWRRYDAGEWEPDTRELVEDVLYPGALFVDIGAWIGPVTLWALGCGAQVVAIEPDPVALKHLRTIPDIEIWEGAVATQSGRASLVSHREFGASVSRLTRGDGYKVRTWTLDEVLGGRRPALVKIDVEGYEVELLPSVAPLVAEMGATLQVALHGRAADPEWFADFGRVSFPASPRGCVVASPIT